MAKKELRLAVVIYGGASLAVYMHGITKELLKLVRASKVFHELGPDRARDLDYGDGPDPREYDTEAVYFDCLKAINARTHFRVVVDVIAGASAGAINGVMLGKALVDDGALEAQTSLWLNDADVDHLARNSPSLWRKWYLFPFLRGLSWLLPKEISASQETRSKFERVLRSNWFEAPFSGTRLADRFLAGLQSLVDSRRRESSLLPPGQQLDMVASITDLAGYPSAMQLHDQLIAREREHGAFCRFVHRETPAGREASDFADGNLPALVWAARASSSFAGAFEPFRHDELVALIARRGLRWPGERRFLEGSLFTRDGVPLASLMDPRERLFVDGGIVNNKPFAAALEVLNNRSADRQVARYIAYIEPDPNLSSEVRAMASTSWLGTIRHALSTIPRNQPILDDLREIVAQDERVQINRRIVDANQAQIQAVVAEVLDGGAPGELDPQRLNALRGELVERAAREYGLAYRAYLQRRVWRLSNALVDEWLLLSNHPSVDWTRAAMTRSVEQWWQSPAPDWNEQNRQNGFLDRFDVTFRIRRLQFVIRRLNQHEQITGLSAADTEVLDDLKGGAYATIERLLALRRARLGDDALIARLAEAAAAVPLEREDARALLEALSASMELGRIDDEVDGLLACFARGCSAAWLRNALLSDYLGFVLYDVLLMTPRTLEGGPDPLTPVRVERISPADAPALADEFDGLKCRDFMGFIGFFNREYREHDYLWGRLHGAERLLDLLLLAAGRDLEDPEALRRTLRRRLFASVLGRERERLQRCDGLLRRLQRIVDRLPHGDPGGR